MIFLIRMLVLSSSVAPNLFACISLLEASFLRTILIGVDADLAKLGSNLFQWIFGVGSLSRGVWPLPLRVTLPISERKAITTVRVLVQPIPCTCHVLALPLGDLFHWSWVVMEIGGCWRTLEIVAVAHLTTLTATDWVIPRSRSRLLFLLHTAIYDSLTIGIDHGFPLVLRRIGLRDRCSLIRSASILEWGTIRKLGTIESGGAIELILLIAAADDLLGLRLLRLLRLVLAQTHVLLEFHKLLHLGFRLDGGDMLAQTDLEMLEICVKGRHTDRPASFAEQGDNL